MIVSHHISDLRKQLMPYQKGTERIGAVLTMGAIHGGHLALIRAAKKACDIVVATIFLNPAQFDKKNDLNAYPLDLVSDISAFRRERVDFAFIPEAQEIYPAGDETIVETKKSANILHGTIRPGHFCGVTTVVARFFNIIQPDATFFGEKDYQQLQIIRRMVRDLHFPIEIHSVPTARAPDGLALSSRNQLLGSQDRIAALVLSRALEAARIKPRPTTIENLKALIRKIIQSEPRAKLCAVDIVDADTLGGVEGPLITPVAIMVCAKFGGILLLDQSIITP